MRVKYIYLFIVYQINFNKYSELFNCFSFQEKRKWCINFLFLFNLVSFGLTILVLLLAETFAGMHWSLEVVISIS